MDPCAFVRILVGNVALKFPVSSKPGIHPSSSPCFCKIKLKNFPSQYAAVPLIPRENQTAQETNSTDHSLAACFTLDKTHIDELVEKRRNPFLEISVYMGRRGATCGLNTAKLLGTVPVEIDLRAVETRASNIHHGWVNLGENKKGSSAAQFYLSVRAEPDPRFVFQFDAEPECSPQVFQVREGVRQPVFSCEFSFRNAGDSTLRSWSSMSERSNSRNCLAPMGSLKDQKGKERKGWNITIHDLSGSPVAKASMVTPFVPSPGSHRVSQSNPGAWLILRPGDGTWKPWGRLEAWRESGGPDAVGYRFELLSSADTATSTTLASASINANNGGKFSIDMTSSVSVTPVNNNSPHSSCDFGSGSWSGSRSRSRSRSGSGSGSEFGFGWMPQLLNKGGFVMSSTVEKAGKCSRPEVEVGVQHVTCTEDAATFVALAAAMDLSMDACRLFSNKLRKELRQ